MIPRGAARGPVVGRTGPIPARPDQLVMAARVSPVDLCRIAVEQQPSDTSGVEKTPLSFLRTTARDNSQDASDVMSGFGAKAASFGQVWHLPVLAHLRHADQHQERPSIGADRKESADGQSEAISPTATSAVP